MAESFLFFFIKQNGVCIAHGGSNSASNCARFYELLSPRLQGLRRFAPLNGLASRGLAAQKSCLLTLNVRLVRLGSGLAAAGAIPAYRCDRPLKKMIRVPRATQPLRPEGSTCASGTSSEGRGYGFFGSVNRGYGGALRA